MKEEAEMPERDEDRIEARFERALSGAGAGSPVFPAAARLEMARMVEQVALSDANVARIVATRQSVPIKAGFIAEEFHAGTFSIDAIRKDKPFRAMTEHHDGWKDLGLRSNDPGTDIGVRGEDGALLHRSQSKYCGTAKDSSTAARRTDPDGRHHYGEEDSILFSSDQLPGVKRDSRRAELKNKGTRPDQARAARNVRRKASDRLEHGGASSTPLSSRDAKRIARDGRAGRRVREEAQAAPQTASTLQSMGRAAAGAAAISAVASGALNTLACLRQVRDGRMTESDAVLKIMGETAAAATDSALKAAAATGAESALVRYGSREAAKSLAKQGLRGLARTNAVTVGVVCAIDAIKDLVSVASGKMDGRTFADRNSKNLVQTSAGVWGASVAAAACPSGGLAVGGLALGPIAAGVAGAAIVGMAVDFAVENHIERPYRELLENTERTRESARLFREAARDVLEGQAAFTAFLGETARKDAEFDVAVAGANTAGWDMSKAIDAV